MFNRFTCIEFCIYFPDGSCPEYWVLFNNKTCYHYNSSYTDWEGATRLCKENGGYLVVIKNAEEQKDVRGEYQMKSFIYICRYTKNRLS